MAAVLYLIFAAYFASVVQSAPAKNDICTCEMDSADEQQRIWEFLKEIDAKEDQEPIAPGLLAPLISCSNCIEYNRRKRNPSKTDVDEVKEIENAEDKKNHVTEDYEDIPEDVDYGFPTGQDDKSCPEGTLRVGKWCAQIPATLL